MQDKLATYLGKPVFDRIEAKAQGRGIQDIWKRAEERANAELPGANEAELVARAAVRAQQIVGMIPRGPAPASSPVVDTAVVPVADAPAGEEPAKQRPRRSATTEPKPPTPES